jgi:hypothetical protein
MLQLRQPGPDSALDFEAKGFKTFQGVDSSRGSGGRSAPAVDRAWSTLACVSNTCMSVSNTHVVVSNTRMDVSDTRVCAIVNAGPWCSFEPLYSFLFLPLTGGRGLASW